MSARLPWTTLVVGAVAAWALQCHFLSYDQPLQAPALSCYADEVQGSCRACLDRRSQSGCSWCSDARGEFCCKGDTGPNAVTDISRCQEKPCRDRQDCASCASQQCKWCGDTKTCVSRGDDGRFPDCGASVQGTQTCP